jgi:D-alanyl-D-alanine carboxypeptidase
MAEESWDVSARRLARGGGGLGGLKPSLGCGRRMRLATIAAVLAALTALSLGVSPALAVDVPTHADVQRALERIVEGGAPGVSAVIQGPHGSERFAAGSADLRRDVPISPRDRFRVGSVTKSFTATVVLKLVAQGKIALSDTVEKWLPGMVPGGDHIAIRELLNHSSGLADYCNVPPSSTLCIPLPAEMARRWSARQLVRIGISAPVTFPAGQGWSYSNTGYILLGMIVEKVSGKPIGTEYQRKIFEPLGLHATQFRSGTQMARPYSHGYDVLTASSWPLDVTGTSPTIAGSAGGIVSTPGDLATFMRALMGGRLLSSTLMRQMRHATPGSLDGPTALEGGGIGSYGLGLVHYTWSHACGVWGHSGDFPGFHTLALSTSDGKRGAAIYTNSDALAPPGAIASLQAERLLACRMRFGRIRS